jgi:hypothetical protein
MMLGLVLLSAPLIAAEEEEKKEEDAALVLTKDNFEEKVKGSKFALVGVSYGRRRLTSRVACSRPC